MSPLTSRPNARLTKGLPILAAVALAAAGGGVAWSMTGDRRGAAAPTVAPATAATVVRASSDGCVLGGGPPRAGDGYFQVVDDARLPVRVTVNGSGPAAALVFGQIAMVAPGTDAQMPVDLGAGSYVVSCSVGGGAPAQQDFQVASSGPTGSSAARGMPPVDMPQLLTAIAGYDEYVGQQLQGLTVQLATLRAAVVRGDRRRAELDYPLAHACWERIGAAYNAFPPYGEEIDGSPFGLPGGRSNPQFTGFHRLEEQLWTGAPTPAVVGTIDVLAGDVGQLESRIRITPSDYVVRAHEILEDSLTQQVTGVVEPYSHTGVADTAASTAAAQFVWGTLEDLVQQADAPLAASIAAGFTRLDTVLASLRRSDGSFVADDQLTTLQREELTGAIGALLGSLDQLPGLLQPPVTGPGDST